MIAVLYDTRLLAVMSIAVTILYFVFKLSGWIKDNFNAIPNQAKGQETMPMPGGNTDPQTTNAGDQGSEEGKQTDSIAKTYLQTGHGVRVRPSEAEPLLAYASYSGITQGPALFLRGRWQDNLEF